MKVDYIPISSVIPYARNPRKNDEAATKVAASIKEFGWQQPIVVDSEMVIIAGHTRLLAAQRLGLDEVPVAIAADLTPEQVKAFRIADNRLAQEAEWDVDLLMLEVSDLKEVGFDFNVLGFDEGELFGDEQVAFPDLPSGEREPFQQVAFKCHDSQVDVVKSALSEATSRGFGLSDANENRNANAITYICAEWLERCSNG